MVYNAKLHKWEGNETILDEFDQVLPPPPRGGGPSSSSSHSQRTTTTRRPGLISPFGSTRPSLRRSGGGPDEVVETGGATLEDRTRKLVALGGGGGGATETASNDDASLRREDATTVSIPANDQQSSTTKKTTLGAAREGVKVVGDMAFDPLTCSWHSISGPEAEDELDLFFGCDNDDEEEEEGDAGMLRRRREERNDEDGWSRGERERMLRTRASFVLEEGASDGSSSGSEDKGATTTRMTKRGIYRESRQAETRVRREMQGWIKVDDGDRSWLFELRHVSFYYHAPLFFLLSNTDHRPT